MIIETENILNEICLNKSFYFEVVNGNTKIINFDYEKYKQNIILLDFINNQKYFTDYLCLFDFIEKINNSLNKNCKLFVVLYKIRNFQISENYNIIFKIEC